jgi:hypothetical protein
MYLDTYLLAKRARQRLLHQPRYDATTTHTSIQIANMSLVRNTIKQSKRTCDIDAYRAAAIAFRL